VDAKDGPPMIKIITYVLDDDIEELELLEPHLREVCGCHLELFTNQDEFIAAIQKGFHICIIDHQLNANIDGVEVGRKVLEKNKMLFLILYSGSPSPKVWQAATNSGFRRLVDKNDRNHLKQLATIVKDAMPLIRAEVKERQCLEKLSAKYENY
jgi:DNA-binding NtrC family response regulator